VEAENKNDHQKLNSAKVKELDALIDKINGQR